MVKAKLDRSEVISNATRLFWEKGYAQSSIQDITRVTGLQPGSIYHSFGSKKGMFEQALATYGEYNKRTLEAALLHADDPLMAICNALIKMMQDAQDTPYCSCFLVKTQIELTDEKNHSTLKLANALLSDAEQIFRTALEKVYPKQQAEDNAASLMVHIFGMRVYALMTDDISQLLQPARQGLPWLPWQRALDA